jgi:hypothetical protein
MNFDIERSLSRNKIESQEINKSTMDPYSILGTQMKTSMRDNSITTTIKRTEPIMSTNETVELARYYEKSFNNMNLNKIK